MNRFLKKRAPEPLNTNTDALNALTAGAPPTESPPPLKKSATSRWKKGKKPVELRPEPSFDIALPSNDDFRTSLFMPGLSARFSMLKEQDDPNSLLGKASDDSVLVPRRRSRMDFGLAKGGLDDIAEVQSTKSSIRPPFAGWRQDSFASEDGYGSENDSSQNGSVMSRARRGEGNTMFGGRQKVFMIPKGGASSSRNLGRAVYEDDIGQSAFQRYRKQREMEDERTSEESHGFDFGLEQAEARDQEERRSPLPNDSAKDLSHSPSLSSSDKKRSTNSTSHSEARSSTAATSVASQPATSTTSPVKGQSQSPQPIAAPAPSMNSLKRADTKTRRLYEQGLDQHMHEQQSSAMNRLNSIHRQRTLTNKQPAVYLHSTRSASNLHEKARQPVYAISAQDSPSVTPLHSPLVTTGLSNSAGVSPIPSVPTSPLTSQPGMDLEEHSALTQALEPGDRGKATAMGAFNKPKQSFDEQQYLERQRQLQRSASNAAIKKEMATQSAREQHFESQKFLANANPINPYFAPTPQPIPAEPQPASAYSVFQKAAQLMNARKPDSQPDRSVLPDPHRTFFGDISASDSEDDEEGHRPTKSSRYRVPDYGYGSQHGRWQPTVLPAVSEHPALRSHKSQPSLAEAEDEDQMQPPPATAPANFSRGIPTRTQKESDHADSPVPNSEAEPVALGGLMQHLRQQSNVSSITQRSDVTSMIEAPGPAELTSKNLDLVNRPLQHANDSDSRVGSYAISNPWDLDDADSLSRGQQGVSRAPVSPIDNEHLGGRFTTGASSSLNRRSAVSELEPEAANDGVEPSESQSQHTRDTSNATQQERDDFDTELAARRNAIQEKIRKSQAERETQSRGVSPAPSASGAFRSFGMLRSRPSRESVDSARPPDLPPLQVSAKALKILGPGAGAPPSGHPAMSSPIEPAGRMSDVGQTRDRSISRPPLPNGQIRSSQRSEPESRRQWQQSRSRENSEPEPFPPANRSPPSSVGGRSRANSTATSGRSRSRTGPYRDDLEKAMAEGTGSSTAALPEMSPMIPREMTPRSTPEISQSPFEPPRARSGSRAAMTNYFDAKTLQPLHTSSRERLTPGVPSPALTPNLNTPLVSPAPRSPAGSFAHNMTPPLSGANTPLQTAFTAPPQMPPSSSRPSGALRKKTISKGNISEPTLISSTSNVDLVDLPEGASLRNGMDDAPPVPPLNPARRTTRKILGIGRKESQDSTSRYGARSKTPDAHMMLRSPEPEELPSYFRSRSDTLSPQKPGPKQSMDQSSGMMQNGYTTNGGSPPRMIPTPPHAPVEGVMF